MQNEKGITLIELLAVLLLASIIVGILTTTLSIGLNQKGTQSDKVRLQQEANLVISKITQKHRNGICYNLIDSNEELHFITYKLDTDCGEETELTVESRDTKRTVVTDNIFKYEINNNNFKGNPKKCDLKLRLTVKDPDNNKLKVTVNTIISRIKTGDGEGCENEENP